MHIIKPFGQQASDSARLTEHGLYHGRRLSVIQGRIARSEEKPGFMRRSIAPKNKGR